MHKTRTASHVEGASLAHRGSCDCRSTSAPDALSEFLSLLSDRHLSELARQCEIDEKQTVGRDQLVRSILAFRLRRPDRDLRISNGAKLRNMMVPSGGPHLLGNLDVSLLKRVSMATNKLSIQSMPTLELDPSYEHRVHFVLRAPATWASFFSGMTFGCALVQPQLVMSGLTIGDHEVLVVETPSLRIEGLLKLGKGARVFGVHPCGLDISCHGLHAGPESMISTSMRSATFLAAKSLAGDGFPNLFKYEDSSFLTQALSLDGATGAAGVDRGTRRGEDGEHGTCIPTGPLSPPAVLPAEDGEDVGDGLHGGAGEQGGPGAATRPLRLTVDEPIQGKIVLSTRAGDGGKGGTGGAGESVEGGNGGNAPMFGCPFDAQGKYPQPGRGGKAGKGGDAGSGGNGGAGGDAGGIWIRVSGLSPGAVQSSVEAISRGGGGGSGGSAHYDPLSSYLPGGPSTLPGGSSVGGDPGKWVLLAGLVVDQIGDAGLPGQWGGFSAKGVQGQTGARGCNGQISVWTDAGWEVEVAPNHELQPQNWSWPTVEPSTT